MLLEWLLETQCWSTPCRVKMPELLRQTVEKGLRRVGLLEWIYYMRPERIPTTGLCSTQGPRKCAIQQGCQECAGEYDASISKRVSVCFLLQARAKSRKGGLRVGLFIAMRLVGNNRGEVVVLKYHKPGAPNSLNNQQVQKGSQGAQPTWGCSISRDKIDQQLVRMLLVHTNKRR